MVWIWLFGYGLLYTLVERLSLALHSPFSLSLPAIIAYQIVLIWFLRRRGLWQSFGLCKPQHTGIFLYVPLLSVPIAARLLFRLHSSPLSPVGMLCEGLQIFCYVFGEEIFFRGFLLLRISGKYQLRDESCLALSTLAFSLLHFVNLFAGAVRADVCVQVLYAAAIGLCLAVCTLHTRSILPSFLLHFAINLLAGGGLLPQLSRAERLYYGLAAVALFAYGLWLYQALRKPNHS